MAIRTTPSDTTFSYLCDWQYTEMQNNTASNQDTAEYFAIFFMTLDKNVFGHNRFTIIDKNLFKMGNSEARYVIFPGDQNRQTRNNILTPVEVCTNVHIPYGACSTPSASQCIPTCDECIVCTAVVILTYCWTEYIDDGSGGGSGTGGTGGTGGGGNGNTTPSECPGTPTARTEDVTNPCQPGWEPGPTYSTEDPCIKLSPFTTDSYFKNAFTDLKNKANPNAPNPENREYIYKYQSDGIMVGPVAGEPNKCEIEQKTMYMLPVKAYMHSHYPGCPEPIFSPGDIQLAFDLYKTSKVIYPFVFALATAQGNYVMVINDPSAFDAFGSKYFLEDSPKDPSDLARVFKTYKLSLSNPFALNEKLFLDFLKEQNVTGIELLKANSDFTQYKKLTLKRDGQLLVIPCN